jgi:hypothetical protein
MALPADFIASLEPIPPRDLFEMIKRNRWPKGGVIFELFNEIRPVDLFCYLGARFGRPNGVQNFLRKDDSDNLIHWEWTLRHKAGLVSFQGMSFRTEIHVYGGALGEADKEQLIAHVKADFGAHGPKISEVRRTLERWVEFVNPYQRIRRSIDGLLEELRALNLQPDPETLHADVWTANDPSAVMRQWEEAAARYSKGFGFCFGIRSMLPILAEAYINLIIYILMRSEIRGDDRLRDTVFRQPIDVRIKSLSINCIGFAKQPDYASDACKRYHSLVNERNDLLHGNVAVDKLRFNEVYFLGTVPIFDEYRTMWQRSLGVMVNAVGLRTVEAEVAVVNDLIGYVQSCLDEEHRTSVTMLAERYELGLNRATRRVGLLFPPWLVDFRAAVPRRDDAAGPKPSAQD